MSAEEVRQSTPTDRPMSELLAHVTEQMTGQLTS